MDIKKLLLNRTLFLASAGVFAAAVVVCLIYFSLSRGEEVDLRDIMEEVHHRPTVLFPVNLHAVGFNREQLVKLQRAAMAWEYKTGRSVITVVPWVPTEPFDDIRYQYHPLHTIWLLDGNNPKVAVLLAKHSVTMGGLCKGRYIGVMKGEDADMETIAKHEMGHLMGLEHIRPEYPALMNLKSRGVITKYDMMQFDFLYE